MVWSLAGVVAAFGERVMPLASWAIGIGMGAAIAVTALAPRGLEMTASGRVQVPGSWVPLIVMMGIVCLKFANGVVVGAHLPVLAHAAYVAAMSASFGVLSGMFLARALGIIRFARSFDATGPVSETDRRSSALPIAGPAGGPR